MSDLFDWCVDQLHHRFGIEACDDIVRYVLTIEDQDELQEYVGDLLQGTDGKKRHFMDELLKRWEKSQKSTTETLLVMTESTTNTDTPEASRETQKKSKRKGRNKEVLSIGQAEPEPEAAKTPLDEARGQDVSSSAKKKNKFVNLYAKEGQDKLLVLLPGRHACECLAQKHKLINNCLSCGRIVCEQEGSGPCLFCGRLVCSQEEQEVLQRDSNKSQKLRKKLMGESVEREYLTQHDAAVKAGLEKALQHKDKLLEFDRNSVSRTRVLDDEADYFSSDSNAWLSPEERENLRKKEAELKELRHASRRNLKVHLDFTGRRVREEPEDREYYIRLDETLKAMNCDPSSPMFPRSSGQRRVLGDLVNPNIHQKAPEWVDVGDVEDHKHNLEEGRKAQQRGYEPGSSHGSLPGSEERSKLRLQDPELQEVSDGGWCLSMHQPWASLLVTGIKRVEGRSWYTSHRGRLWIAAAAKKLTPQEINEVENIYRHLSSSDLTFPKEYPTGCLLGCVNVTDCLPQEQFREKFPDLGDESSSPFVLICSSPQELLVKFPMRGKHKIWKMESHYHQGAKRGLRPATI